MTTSNFVRPAAHPSLVSRGWPNGLTGNILLGILYQTHVAARRLNCARRVASLRALAGVAVALNEAHAALEVAFNIKQATLEELMVIDVYSAARRLDPIQGVPSAIFALTNEDLRRAHVTSIPEALRLVPGVQVARVDANKWALGIRGFNARTSNKLLVLIDGRSSPKYQYTLRSALNITNDLHFDATLRAVDDLAALKVPDYTTLDLGFSGHIDPGLELSLVGQNLLERRHPEQPAIANGNGTEVERDYYAELMWKF